MIQTQTIILLALPQGIGSDIPGETRYVIVVRTVRAIGKRVRIKHGRNCRRRIPSSLQGRHDNIYWRLRLYRYCV
ncbi:MAG TPA: hypothetical protein VKC66_33555, partial [Xanthobacteraceae bacterium]|nr:hypothetical protein [Xanthobacteraceae bacterium]